MGTRNGSDFAKEMQMNPEALVGFFINILRFIILLGVLIFVHELGHFLAAKASNVYVVRLALGFGKRLIGFKWGETDYCIKAIPLGGYVKMVGQEDMPKSQEEVEQAEQADPEIRNVPPERRFDTQSTRKKIFIGLAGPAMNLLFAIPVLWVAYVIGINVPAYSQQTFIGAVTPGSPAEEAGIEAGERILSINGQPVKEWEDVQLKILTSQDSPLTMKLEDFSGKTHEIEVTPQQTEDSKRATIGIEPFAAMAIGEVLPGLPASESGLKQDDIILAYDGKKPINTNKDFPLQTAADQLVESVNKHVGQPMEFTVLRDGNILHFTVTPKEKPVIKGLNISNGVIAFIDKKQLGEEAAMLREGDEVIALNGEPVRKQDLENQLLEKLKDSGTVQLTVKQKEGFLKGYREVVVDLPVSHRGVIGVLFSGDIVKQFGPGEAVAYSIDAYKDFMSLTMKTIYYLITGRVSTREMAGPIGIAFLTTQSLKLGIGYYLKLVALITINLGIINLLPIPVLDGGMILVSFISGVRRKPIEEKYLLLLQRIGFAFIIFLVLIATYNDILRVINYFLGRGFLE
jgi:regulator of sigma E protease